MPHGVSDYAVGSAMQMSFASPPMAMMARKEARAAREYEALKTFDKGQASAGRAKSYHADIFRERRERFQRIDKG